jgi:hypothetical protein
MGQSHIYKGLIHTYRSDFPLNSLPQMEIASHHLRVSGLELRSGSTNGRVLKLMV